MHTVEDRLAKAQASGDLPEIRSALQDAQAAGADPKQIEQALAEVDRMEGIAKGAGGNAAVPKASCCAGGTCTADGAAELRTRAEAHKKKGNELIQKNTKSAAREALECFTSGLEVRCSDRVLNAQLHSNRAHVRMLLRQFVEAVDDCRKAIEMDPKNVKAYWRAGKASLHLDLCKNAIEFCEAGLQQNAKEGDLIKLRDTCAEKLAGQQQRRSELVSSSQQQSDFNPDEAMAVQENVNNLNDQIENLKMSIGTKQRERMKAELTRAHMKDTPEEASLYCAVGRTFMKEDRSKIEESLNTTIESLVEELPKLSKTHQELEKRKEAAEKELKEMIGAFKQQTDRSSAAAA